MSENYTTAKKENSAEQTKKWATINGWLKYAAAAPKTSKNGYEFYSMTFEISEIIGKNKDDPSLQQIKSPIRLIFWKTNFDVRTQELIANLKEGQNLTVSGQIQLLSATDKNDKFGAMTLLNVKSIETDSELFI